MDLLFKYLAKRIIVEISPEQFTFSIREKDVTISFAPFMYLEKKDLIWMPIAIGDEIPVQISNKSNVVRFDINDFKDTTPSNSIISNEVFLQLLFEYGIGRCFENFWFPQLKPVVFILGANRFNKYFKSPPEIFELAAKRSGAKYVLFDMLEL